MERFNWGVLGTGLIANEFAEDLARLPDAILHSCHSRTFEKAENFANRFGFGHNHRELHSFLDDSDLDIVYIATPNHLHHRQALQCMKAGKHVVVEKPIALNVKEMEEIAATAREYQCFCMEAVWTRFMPVYQRIGELLAHKAIGEVKMFSADFGHIMPYNPDEFRFSLQTGGGALMDLGVYPISLAVMLLGKPAEISGKCSKGDSGVDLHNAVTLSYDNGCIANLGSSFSSHLPNRCWIGGDSGSIEVESPMYRPKYFRLNQYDASDLKSTAGRILNNFPRLKKAAKFVVEHIINPLARDESLQKHPYTGNGYYHEAEAAMEAIRNQQIESTVMPLSESLRVLEITDELRNQWNIKYPGID